MNLQIAPNYESLSQMAAQALLQVIANNNSPLLCTASGDSPAGLYKALAQQVKQQGIATSKWKFLGLDEWLGMNEQDEGSAQWHLTQQLFSPMGIRKEQVCFFDGRAAEPEAECRRIENFIREEGGIDVAIVGIGLNGHIGMNEPGTDPGLRSHVADIHPLTQQTGQKYFTQPQSLTRGLTLGLATILAAKHIFLLASGRHKAEIISQALTEAPSPELPATLLRDHPGLTVFLDSDAAQLMPPPGTNAMG